MDPEAPIRERFKISLSSSFDVFEEVPLESKSGKRVRCDILLLVRDFKRDLFFAIEIKSKKPAQAKIYRDTYRQALEYVGAAGFLEGYGHFKVDYAFIFHDHGYNYLDIKRNCKDMDLIEQYFMMKGIDMAFNSMDVGHIVAFNGKFIFQLGSNEVWSEKRGFGSEILRRI
jgi:hypothetical protein